MTSPLRLPRHVEGCELGPLRRELLARLRHDPHLTLDCSQVDRLSPAGQALLLHTHRAARRRSGALRLDQLSPAMAAALRASGLHHWLAGAPAAATTQATPKRRSAAVRGWSRP